MNLAEATARIQRAINNREIEKRAVSSAHGKKMAPLITRVTDLLGHNARAIGWFGGGDGDNAQYRWAVQSKWVDGAVLIETEDDHTVIVFRGQRHESTRCYPLDNDGETLLLTVAAYVELPHHQEVADAVCRAQRLQEPQCDTKANTTKPTRG